MVYYLATTKTITTIELADLFFNEIVYYFSILASIISNRGSVFISAF